MFMNERRINRTELVSTAIERWLRPDNRDLKLAIESTVDEELFSLSDIKHRILSLKKSLNRGDLIKWAVKSGCNPHAAEKKKILCLHAGNLPLVGIQDLLAIMLTGGTYIGKLSKKDPYLLPSFLKVAEEMGITDSIQTATELDTLKSVKADAVLYAGSEKSVPAVTKKLRELDIADNHTPSLIRTAHYSVAWIHDSEPKTFKDLTEAVFRYGGKGCRSVAIVVSPYSLKSNVCTFTDYVENFWLYNPQHEKPPDSLIHRFAMNKAVGIDQSWLDDFLIEETLEHPEENFILYWVKGGEPELREIIQKYNNGLQSIYSTGSYIGKSIGNFTVEPLSDAQTPPVWWKPDGIDPIGWIQSEVV